MLAGRSSRKNGACLARLKLFFIQSERAGEESKGGMGGKGEWSIKRYGALYGLIWPYKALYGVIWPYKALCCLLWPYKALYGHTTLYRAIYGHTRLYMAIECHTRLYRAT
jgi:hypothetical protein